MLLDTKNEMQKQWDKGNKLRSAHLLGVDQVPFSFIHFEHILQRKKEDKH